MAENDTPKGPYTLWLNLGCYEGWRFTDYPTLKEALEAEKHGIGWHVSKPVAYTVTDTDAA
jgi:hypothetical protein